MRIVFDQVTKCHCIAVLLWVERILLAFTLLDSRFEVFLIVYHFRMIDRFSDMFPSFIGQIDTVAVEIVNCPPKSFVHDLNLEVVLTNCTIPYQAFTLSCPSSLSEKSDGTGGK